MSPAETRVLLAREARVRPLEGLPWLLAIAAFFLLPDYLAFGTQVLITILFALSLDLVLGYAGIVTLGHAAYFGTGAYAAGMLSAHLGWSEPISALAAAGLCAAAVGFVSGLVLLRYHGLTLLMLTLATAILLQELANVFTDLTGGFDGLTGIAFEPLLGQFEYDLWGHTHYLYALVVLFAMFVLTRLVVYSPFGRSLIGIRENTQRMRAIGSPVYRRLVAVYTLSAGMAGVAGGLFAEFNAFVTLDVLSFARSGEVLIILVLGQRLMWLLEFAWHAAMRRLRPAARQAPAAMGGPYGAFLGGALYLVLEDELAKLSPQFWQFGVGLALVVIVLLARREVFAALARLFGRQQGRET